MAATKANGKICWQQLLKTQPSDSAAYDSYMLGIYELENRANRENLTQAVDLFERSIERDEGYGPAYLGLATTYALMVDYFDADVTEFNELDDNLFIKINEFFVRKLEGLNGTKDSIPMSIINVRNEGIL